jgi:cytochrome c
MGAASFLIVALALTTPFRVVVAQQQDSAQRPDPSRYQQEILMQGIFDEPTELAVARDGRVFVTERKGTIRMYDPKTSRSRVLARMDVISEEENGLLGIALDPRFASNGWIYLARTVGDSTDLRHRLARFTLLRDSLRDERVMLEVPITRGCCHTGGSIAFDAQGNLFVSFGDNTNPFATGYGPIDDAPGRVLWDARRSAANTNDLRGKILRIRPRADGGYTVPAGNLFPNARDGRPEIYTMGHRNPYRISVDQRTGFVYWGEVGPDAQIDSALGPRGYDEINQARRAGNFGWPLFIADNKPYLDRDIATGQRRDFFDPAQPLNASRNNTGARVLPPAQPAFIWYPYAASPEFPLVGEGGRTAMAGPVYHAASYPAAAPKLPRYFDRKLIIYEWMRGWMRAVTMNERGDYLRMEPFLEHLTFDHPMDVELGPDGSLYVLEYGTYWFAKNPNARVSRIKYHVGNRPPVANLVASRVIGAAPLTVTLSARGSTDHDPGDTLVYRWTLGRRGTATGPEITRTFATPGRHTVRLTVRDRAGATAHVEQELLVGNTPPVVTIATSGNRSFYWADAPTEYRVHVLDAEDGALGRAIPLPRVRVTLDYRAAGVERTTARGHQADAPGLALMRRSDCLACHGVDQASIGPSFRMIAQRYAGEDSTITRLAGKVVAGGSGVWGTRVMPPHRALSGDVAQEMVRYIMTLASAGTALPASGTLRFDRHRANDTSGAAYVLTARYVDRARNGIGPLEGIADVVFRSPTMRAADVSEFGSIGLARSRDADGQERTMATVYASGAHLHVGATDLSGIGSVSVAMQALGHPVTVEMRAGGVSGEVLGSAEMPAGARDAWVTARVPLAVTGERDLYFVVRSDARELGQWNPLTRIDVLRFERRAP